MKIKFENESEIRNIGTSEDVKRGCIRGRQLTNKEYKSMIYNEQIQAEERVSKIIKKLGI